MNYKGLCLVLVLVSLLALMVAPHPVSAQTYGPWSDEQLIHVYLNADAENADLESGVLDVIDWPLTKYWIDKWTGNPDIVMRSYAGGGKREFDLNCQRWPTGVTLPRTYDPATKTYKHWQDYSNPWELKAREFRRALAYLSDKDGYIDRILKGYGYRMDTTVPTPFLAGYVNLDVSGLNYPYRFNPAQAAIVLDAAGFTQGTTPNPYYDNTQPWSAQYLRIDPKGDWSETGAPGGNLKPLIFYARLDDPLRSDAAKELTLMAQKSGIPVDLRIRARAECSDKVMNIYDYHLYTGGWNLEVFPTWVYTLYASPFYCGGTATDYYGGRPGSGNYPGYVNYEYDTWSAQAYFTIDPVIMKWGVMESQEVYVRDCPIIDLWADAAFKAYRSKWSGMVNMEGYGVDNAWSFFNMKNTVGDKIIDYGFMSTLEGPHIFNSRWVWDRNIVGTVYEGLIATNPYNYAMGYEKGTTCDFDHPYDVGLYGPSAKTRVTYHMRNDVYFHNGRPMTPYDAAFSLILFRDSGPANYWYHSSVKDIDYIEVQNNAPTYWAAAHPHVDIRSNPALPANDVAVYFKVASLWARYWGSQYVIDSYMWLKANDRYGWNFGGTPTYYDTGSGPTPKGVVAYKPWEEDADENGVIDMYEDGTNEWVMDGTSGGTAGTWTWVHFHAFDQHYWSQEFVESFINYHIHCLYGNVNYPGAVNAYPSYDLEVNIIDGSYIRNAFGTTPAWGNGTKFDQWNVDCDFTGRWLGTPPDNEVTIWDLFTWAIHYGESYG